MTPPALAVDNNRLIFARWIAATSVIGATFTAVHGLKLPLEEFPLYVLGSCMIAYNVVLWWVTRRQWLPLVAIVNLQIGLDWFCMSILLNLTGGITSPALLFFFLHVIIVAILLPEESPYFYVIVVIFSVISVTFAEASGIIPHYRPIHSISNDLHRDFYFIAAEVIFLGIALVTTAYLTTSIMQPLRQHERRIMAMVDALQQAEIERIQFIHLMTHELRSPVTGAQSLIRMMLYNLQGELTPPQRDTIEHLSRRMDALLLLINDLLALETCKSLELQKPVAPVNLYPLIGAAIEKYKPQASEKKQVIHYELPAKEVCVQAHPEGITRILDNLLDNAIKYTPVSGEINVRLALQEEQIILSVSDTGIGIPEYAIEQLGQEFYRADNARESGIMGTGLGLATVKQLIANFNGSLHIQSQIGKGTTFKVYFPFCGA